MKIGILSDCHLGAIPYKLEQKKQDIFEKFNYYLDRFQDLKVDLLIIAGDLFDKEKIDYETLKIASRLKDFKNFIFFIEGNHDLGVSDFFSSISVPKSKIKVLDNGLILVGIDYKHNVKEIQEELIQLRKDLELEDCILILHHNYAKVMPYLKENVITYEIIKDFKQVIIGHFHEPFIDKNVLIPGSIDRLDSKNILERKLFLLEVKDNLEIEVNYEVVESRPILKTSNKKDIYNLIEDSRYKPIVIYEGKKEDLTLKDILFFEKKCLLFKVRTIIKDTNIFQVESDSIIYNKEIVKEIVNKFLKEKKISSWIKKVLFDNWGNIEQARKNLEKIKEKEA